METETSSRFSGLTLSDIFADLASRFVINLPANELASMERICFQVEQCHWFYEDFIRPERPDLPSLAFRKFAELFLTECSPHLPAFDYNPKRAIDAFMAYKSSVPTRGAILMNKTWDKLVLVKGWKANSAWGFPKGKINQNENDRDCAVREVWEEIGYDISTHYDPTRSSCTSEGPPAPVDASMIPVDADDFVDIHVNEQLMRLFIVPNVDEDAVFETRTRKEISKIAWFGLKELPGWSKQSSEEATHHKFYLVAPVMRALRGWMSRHKHLKQQPPGNKKHSHSNKQAAVAAPAFASLDEGNRALQEFFLGTVPTSTSTSEPVPAPQITILQKGQAMPQSQLLEPEALDTKAEQVLLQHIDQVQQELSSHSSQNASTSSAKAASQTETLSKEQDREVLRSKLLQDLDQLVGLTPPPAPAAPEPAPNREKQAHVNNLLDTLFGQPVGTINNQNQPQEPNFSAQYVSHSGPLPPHPTQAPLSHVPQSNLPSSHNYAFSNPTRPPQQQQQQEQQFRHVQPQQQHMLLHRQPQQQTQPFMVQPIYPPNQFSPQQYQQFQSSPLMHVNLSQPTPIRPIPLLSYTSPAPPVSYPGSKPVPANQSAALLSLLNNFSPTGRA